ncbi:MAG TPA: methyltransferase domain-containing protein [Vicinamibacteria bacterium]|nr:methyltransferase domain-containing protein [Vicinamibacteria bacterium]
MTLALPKTPSVDRETLRAAIRNEYQMVAQEPERGFHFHTGRKLAGILGYGDALLDGIPETAIESFAGTGNPFSMGELEPGERVVDVGCGAGMDSLIAARMVGPRGEVVGIDMTPEMLGKAEAARKDADLTNVEFRRGYVEELPVSDEWADVVISNGVFNLTPDKMRTLKEMARVLKRGGRLQLGDILVEKPVSEKAKERIDLWTG